MLADRASETGYGEADRAVSTSASLTCRTGNYFRIFRPASTPRLGHVIWWYPL